MNAIFAAKKGEVPVDALVLIGGSGGGGGGGGAGSDSVYLKQACNLTDGVYLRPEPPAELLQHLLFACLPDRHARSRLEMPAQREVDFRASCFVDGVEQPVDEAWVCSVCLTPRSSLADLHPICKTCGSKTVNPNRRDAKRRR